MANATPYGESSAAGDPPAALSHHIPMSGNPHQVLAPQRTASPE
jgi:hypothetical protein